MLLTFKCDFTYIDRYEVHTYTSYMPCVEEARVVVADQLWEKDMVDAAGIKYRDMVGGGTCSQS